MPTKAHCPRCAGYEDQVMRRKEGEELPASATPCPTFEMSDRFRDWAVNRMRGEVGGLIGAAGLDRMAILKGKSKADNVAGEEKQPK
ncbi:MAG: hypothetical protein AABX89_06620 [Candidatus Thermoplasmatota archaeon]